MVGAPYEGQGAVYVYMGKVGGVSTQFSQKITPGDFPARSLSRSLEGFGISLSRGVDVDKNSYPGLFILFFEKKISIVYFHIVFILYMNHIQLLIVFNFFAQILIGGF